MSARPGVSANRRTTEPKRGPRDTGQDGITVDMRVFAPQSATRAQVYEEVVQALDELLKKIMHQWPPG